jgi:Mg2+ and Co2+ transporter CorA
MERITRDDLKRMKGDMLMEAKTRTVKGIVEQVKRSPQNGTASYMHEHVRHFQTLFTDPNELVARLQEILLDVDVVYAEPYICIRWN